MLFEIKHRISGSVLFALETESIKLCLQAAVEQKTDLRGSNLRGSDLRGSNLSGSDLRYSDLRGSNLRGSDLSGSDLRYSDLHFSDLRGSDLRGSNLSGSDLRYSDLSGSDLRYSDLSGSDLRYSDLRYSDLRGSNLSGSECASHEQAIANLDKVREIIGDDASRLDMTRWHDDNSTWQEHTCAEEAVCGTTHCLAGWLQVCSTDAKVRALDPQLAGIVQAPVASKMFFRSANEVKEWLRERKYVAEISEGNARHEARKAARAQSPKELA